MRKVLAIVVTLGLVGGLVAAFVFFQIARPKGSPTGTPVKLAIKSGTSGGAIAQTLQEKGVIRSALAFRLYLRQSEVTSGLKAGRYELRTDMPFDEVVGKLRQGPEVEFVKLVIPEGLNIDQTALQVEKMTHIAAADFLAQATPAALGVNDFLPAGVSTIEGMLYPSTYFVEKTETAAGLVKRLTGEFFQQFEKVGGFDKAEKLGFTPYQILVIAAMIEEEAKAEDERTKISAVIHNRLKQNIALGIDATIQYAVKKYEGQPLTQSDLEINSPFNTRKRSGLPPWPISSPRAGSIKAALEPADVDFIFYVLTTDCIHHKFAATAAEFNRAKANQPRNC